MPFISDAVVALVRAGAFVLDAGRRALSILRSGLDLFDDVEEVAGRLLHVARDARVAMVRQVLDAATRAIEPR
jgi:hypothetical protein